MLFYFERVLLSNRTDVVADLIYIHMASRHSTRLTFHVLATIPLELAKNHYLTSGDSGLTVDTLSRAVSSEKQA